jgi:hypothetical protein
MKKKEVLENLCDLTAEIMREVFDNEIPADCFCDANKPHEHTSQFIMDFMKEAVRNHIKQCGKEWKFKLDLSKEF